MRTSSCSPAWSSPTATQTAFPWRSWRRWPRACRSWHRTSRACPSSCATARPGCWRPPDDARRARRRAAQRARSSPRQRSGAPARPERWSRSASPWRARRRACSQLIRASAAQADDRLAREASFHDVAPSRRARGAERGSSTTPGATHTTATTSCSTAVVGPGASVLEYGCGPGGRAFELARRGACVHGIDISPVAIELAREARVRQGVDAQRDVLGHGRGGARPPRAQLRPRLRHIDPAPPRRRPRLSRGRACPAAVRPRDLPRAARATTRVFNAYRRLTPGVRTRDEHPLLHGRPRRGGRVLRRPGAGALQPALARGRGAPRAARRSHRWRARCGAPTSGSSRGCRPLRRWSWTVVIVLSRPGRAARKQVAQLAHQVANVRGAARRSASSAPATPATAAIATAGTEIAGQA